MSNLEQDAVTLAENYLRDGSGPATELFHLMTIGKSKSEVESLRVEFQKQIKILKAKKS